MAVRAIERQQAIKTEDCAMESDPWSYRLVIGSLGAVTVIGMLGALFLAESGRDAPQVVVALASGAIGALTGVLAPSPTRRR